LHYFTWITFQDRVFQTRSNSTQRDVHAGRLGICRSLCDLGVNLSSDTHRSGIVPAAIAGGVPPSGLRVTALSDFALADESTPYGYSMANGGRHRLLAAVSRKWGGLCG